MKKLITLGLALVVGSGLIWWFSRSQHSVIAETPVPPNTQGGGGKKEVSPCHGAEILSAHGSASAQYNSEVPGQTSGPILIAPCTLAPIQDQDVSSQLDGQVTEVCVTLGQKVKKGGCLARLDNRKLLLHIQLLEIRANSPTEELIAKAQHEEADAKVKYAEKANQENLKAVPDLELKTYLAQRERFAQEMTKAREERKAAQKELEKALLQLQLHQIQSDLDGEVVKIFKKDGEAVKQAETVFRLARIDRLRIEGFCKVQNAQQLQVGMAIRVEPERAGRQLLELVGHTDAITDVAVTPNGKIIASASSDGKVLLWSWPAGQRFGVLSHPGAVQSMDFARKPAADGSYLLLTGCEDGRVRLWSISSAGLVQKPLWEIKGHEGAIRSVRIHPDGTTCVTGGDDRKVGHWDMSSGRHLGWIHVQGAWKQSAHQGAVTCLEIGKDGLVLSTGTDNVHKVWKVEPGTSDLVKVHRGRTGDVQRLGLSPDGKRVLFDHGDELRLVDLTRGGVHTIIQNWKHARFQEFAGFSPNGSMVLSASAEGRLQLWQTPQGETGSGHQGEGMEICHFLPPRVGKIKCAAFTPDEKVLISGGSDHVVRAWSIPAKDQWQPREATLTYIGSEIEQGTDLVRIQAALDNPEGPQRLIPGTMVVVKINPPTSPK